MLGSQSKAAAAEATAIAIAKRVHGFASKLENRQNGWCPFWFLFHPFGNHRNKKKRTTTTTTPRMALNQILGLERWQHQAARRCVLSQKRPAATPLQLVKFTNMEHQNHNWAFAGLPETGRPAAAFSTGASLDFNSATLGPRAGATSPEPRAPNQATPAPSRSYLRAQRPEPPSPRLSITCRAAHPPCSSCAWQAACSVLQWPALANGAEAATGAFSE